MEIATRYEHITLDEQGVPFIVGTRLKVADLAVEHAKWGWSAEEIAYQHPPLTLGQVYSALAYYWDHRQEIESYLQTGSQQSEALRDKLPTFPRLIEIRSQLVRKWR